MKEQPAEIITITLNPAIDSTLYFPEFHVGEVNRVEHEICDPGGKGVNVAKMIRALGQKVAATGFLGQDNAAFFHEYFLRQQIDDFFIESPGTTRTNIKIVDAKNKITSEINYPGFHYHKPDLIRLEETLRNLAAPGRLFAFSGSLPQDAPCDFYQKLIFDLRSKSCKVFLDTSGRALAEGIKAIPYAVKPNITELREITGRKLQDDAEILATMDDILKSGVVQVVVSMGEAGAFVANHETKWKVKPPRVEAKSTVGAGDAMVAGWIVGESQGYTFIESMRLATAAAAASVARAGTQAGSLAEVENLRDQVIVEDLI